MAFGRNATDQAPPIALPVCFWATGLAGLLAGLAVLLLHPSVLLTFTPGTPLFLLATHCFTLGFVTPMMIGSLYQWLPVVAGQGWQAPRRGFYVWGIYVGGVFLLLLGFAQHDFGWVSAGGALIVIALAGFAAAAVRLLARTSRWTLPLYFVASGIGYLLVTVSLGMAMALNFWLGYWPSLTVLPEHLMVGLGGWFGFTFLGVSYKLLPMFAVARTDPRRGKWALAGLHGAMGMGLLWGIAGAWAAWAAWAAGGFAGLGLAAYLADMGELWRTRRNHDADAAVWAMFIGVALATVAALGLVFAQHMQRWQAVAWFLLLNGWMGLSILALLQKIVPFAMWLHRFHRQRRGPMVPHLKAILPMSHVWQSLGCYVIGLVATTVGLASHSTVATVLGLAMELLGVLRVAWGLWGAWPRSRPADL